MKRICSEHLTFRATFWTSCTKRCAALLFLRESVSFSILSTASPPKNPRFSIRSSPPPTRRASPFYATANGRAIPASDAEPMRRACVGKVPKSTVCPSRISICPKTENSRPTRRLLTLRTVFLCLRYRIHRPMSPMTACRYIPVRTFMPRHAVRLHSSPNCS